MLSLTVQGWIEKKYTVPPSLSLCHYLQHPDLGATLPAGPELLRLWGPQTFQAFCWDTAAAGWCNEATVCVCVCVCVCVRACCQCGSSSESEPEWISLCAGLRQRRRETTHCQRAHAVELSSGVITGEDMRRGCRAETPARLKIGGFNEPWMNVNKTWNAICLLSKMCYCMHGWAGREKGVSKWDKTMLSLPNACLGHQRYPSFNWS